ncbi:thioesterase family protein [Aliiglaciecola sp. LCG003]|uniref:acyl-CoA thioesterase n=1 Tax=Aliiglaciecola sp. LCG003 TaxID=3053655 RepID=UPI00257307FC|nr:thioesterase family protein [Aliiglaciecola sp. LCG003]WJG09492.1 thioesterase family protein [Aliiglaciecola sp. LCG003]
MNNKMSRDQYQYYYPVQTRWSDNDIYGHVNNVQYYSYFDSAVNRYLIEHGGLDIHHSPVVGYVVESKCRYFSPIAYPEKLEIGIRVAKLGNSAVTYELGLFKVGEDMPSAEGYFVHVFVNKQTNQSVSIPEQLRSALEALTF